MSTNKWAIMFVDMVGSTEFKYRYPDAVQLTFADLYKLIQDNTQGKEHMKSTGDGAMVIFRKEREGCKHAVLAAEAILQAVDRRNLTFPNPAIDIRIGIASGDCYEVSPTGPELSGTKVDLAARLCEETESATILVDEDTKTGSGLPSHRFTLCRRRLLLKGVPLPPESLDKYYHFTPQRLLRTTNGENFSKGLLALYPDRLALKREWTPARLIHLATPDSTIIAAGRTLVAWAQYAAEMRMAARKRNVKFQFLVSSGSSAKYLDNDQKAHIQKDWPEIEPVFSDLANEDPQHFEFHRTDHLFLDGIICCRIALPGNHGAKPMTKLLVLQDINAALGQEKASLLFACTCNSDDAIGDMKCQAHGLYGRTRRIFDMEKSPVGLTFTPLEHILRGYREGLSARNNHPSAYLGHVVPHLRAIREDKLDKVPSPLCVQLQISSRCSTHCAMCDHYLSNQRENELTGDEWRRVLENLAKLGVHSVILSGGEPLMREDIVELLDFATANGLAVGMLTNGTMPHENKQTRGRVVKAIHRNVKWIAVSVEGTEIEDQQIRKPDAGSRIDLLQELVAGLKGGPNISATVTLQKGNIDMNLRDACAFIGKHLGIAQVNFKLVTGAWHALHRRPGYLLSEKELGSFLYFLWNYSADLDTEPQSNLGYLRRCFANDIFQEGDVVEGAPLRSFYVNNPLRCFTPFLFSLIDSDGKVYPCCHLYRDNHGADPKSVYFRERHEMGNLRNTAFDFRSVWNGDAYVRERQRLARIAPNNPDFEPCGECTRHCQHNRVLTALYNAYKDKLDELARLACPQRDPVWF